MMMAYQGPTTDLHRAAARTWRAPLEAVAVSGQRVTVRLIDGQHICQMIVTGLYDAYGRYYTEAEVMELCVKARIFGLPAAFYVLDAAGERVDVQITDVALHKRKVLTCLQARGVYGDDLLADLPVCQPPVHLLTQAKKKKRARGAGMTGLWRKRRIAA